MAEVRRRAVQAGSALARLLKEIRACRECAAVLTPRPVVRASSSARILIAGQAPGTRVHASGIPFDDPSGERLRSWLGIGKEIFYDETLVAIVPMGFCFPGLDANGGDLPPRRECASLWRGRLLGELEQVELTLAVGAYAQAWHLRSRKPTMTETVKAWPEYGPATIPLPHPSWRNNAWVRRNPWFEEELLPHLRQQVSHILKG